jgi:hypothetical protein
VGAGTTLVPSARSPPANARVMIFMLDSPVIPAIQTHRR